MDNDLSSAFDALKQMLDSPEASEKIGSLIDSLGASSLFSEQKSTAPTDKSADFDFPVESVMKMAKAYSSIKNDDDARVTLLRAIKPYVRKSRSESVDMAIKLLTLMRLAPMLGDLKDIL